MYECVNILYPPSDFGSWSGKAVVQTKLRSIHEYKSVCKTAISLKRSITQGSSDLYIYISIKSKAFEARLPIWFRLKVLLCFEYLLQV